MFNSPVLDLVILLTFIYFIGSLILSALNEALAGFLKSRPKQLKIALENLFFGDGWRNFVKDTLIVSPHIQSLMKAKNTYPSYIPAENFVMAVISQIDTAGFTPSTLQASIKASPLIPSEFKKVLVDIAAQTQNDLDKWQKKLEEFYNNAMDRAGGVYKKRVRIILLLLGFLIALLMNLDTIRISRDALGNKQQLSQTVDKIVSQLPGIKVSKDSLAAVTIKANNGEITVSQKPAAGDTTKTAAIIQNNVKAVQDLNTYLQLNSGISIGYVDFNAFKTQWFGGHFGDILLSLLGVLMTTFALQMSSSFWFDLMNKTVNVRAAGKKPDTGNKKS